MVDSGSTLLLGLLVTFQKTWFDAVLGASTGPPLNFLSVVATRIDENDRRVVAALHLRPLRSEPA
jgi:hypothetical protein